MAAKDVLMAIVDDKPTDLLERFEEAILEKIAVIVEDRKTRYAASLLEDKDGDDDDDDHDFEWDDLDDDLGDDAEGDDKDDGKDDEDDDTPDEDSDEDEEADEAADEDDQKQVNEDRLEEISQSMKDRYVKAATIDNEKRADRMRARLSNGSETAARVDRDKGTNRERHIRKAMGYKD